MVWPRASLRVPRPQAFLRRFFVRPSSLRPLFLGRVRYPFQGRLDAFSFCLVHGRAVERIFPSTYSGRFFSRFRWPSARSVAPPWLPSRLGHHLTISTSDEFLYPRSRPPSHGNHFTVIARSPRSPRPPSRGNRKVSDLVPSHGHHLKVTALPAIAAPAPLTVAAPHGKRICSLPRESVVASLAAAGGTLSRYRGHLAATLP